tara:strand:+ start:6030 stop:6755 length:726 start_codon:yes stop_codon:yes gene_type:complete
MKKLLFVSALCFLGCNNSNQITITKIEGSTAYDNSKLSLKVSQPTESGYSFSFDLENYELGVQSPRAFDYQLANSAKGQHIHFIINNGPYSAKYTTEFVHDKWDHTDSNNVILAFLSRSYHESVKNKNAYFLTQIGSGDSNKKDLSKELLFYSRPKGVYKGADTERVLLDFYLVNTTLAPDGNKVRVTIQDSEFLIDEWAPFYIEGLPKGEISITLELIDSKGHLIDSPFNPSERTVLLKD